jgi:hypothetical protein
VPPRQALCCRRMRVLLQLWGRFTCKPLRFEPCDYRRGAKSGLREGSSSHSWSVDSNSSAAGTEWALEHAAVSRECRGPRGGVTMRSWLVVTPRPCRDLLLRPCAQMSWQGVSVLDGRRCCVDADWRARACGRASGLRHRRTRLHSTNTSIGNRSPRRHCDEHACTAGKASLPPRPALRAQESAAVTAECSTIRVTTSQPHGTARHAAQSATPSLPPTSARSSRRLRPTSGSSRGARPRPRRPHRPHLPTPRQPRQP